MPDNNTRNLVARVRDLPPTMLDARLLAAYVRTGEAYDLAELAKKSGVSLRQVSLLIVARGLDDVDKLPGYTMTREIYDIAENIYSVGENRRRWKSIRNQHKPEILESKKSRREMSELRRDPNAARQYFARVFFNAWAVFWDDGFLLRMIDELDGRLISSAPPDLLDETVCFAAVAKTGTALRFVPEHLRSVAVCARAVASDAGAIAFTPSHLRDQIRKLAAAGIGS